MTQTKYSTIEVDSKFWLAPEPIRINPGDWNHIDEEFNEAAEDYNIWKEWKSGWIEIKEEHAGEFKGRTGLEKGVHFFIQGCGDDDCYSENCSGCRAIPIKTEQ